MKSRACTRITEAWSSFSLKHRVENLGETCYSAVYIGIKNKRLANEASLKAGPSEMQMQMQMDEQTRKLVAEALLAAMK